MMKNEEEYFWNHNIQGRENNSYEIFSSAQINNVDLEIKPDDFGIFETTETNSSKVYSPSYQSTENQKCIFDV